MRSVEFTVIPDLLDEVKMSPGALEKWASGSETQGMLVGIEYEIYPPLAYGGLPRINPESRVYDIDDIARAFEDTHGYNPVYNELIEQYQEWLDKEGQEWVDEHVRDNIQEYVEELMDLDSEEFQERAREQLGYDADDDEIEELARELMFEVINDEINDQGSVWEKAYDTLTERGWEEVNDRLSESDWLESLDIATVEHAADTFGLPLPDGDDNIPVEQVAEDLQETVPQRVSYSDSYHGCDRDGGAWCVEPDSSLDDPRAGGSYGVELVSPPLSIPDALAAVESIEEMAARKDYYTNSTTGLHINVSVPDYSLENLDYVKLALFSGDKYILTAFDRAFNSYCRSALDKISRNVTVENAGQVLAQMRQGLNSEASKIIHDGMTEKYTSINAKKGWVEFRGPGNDYLNNSTIITATVLRFARALSIACDPEAYKQEYAKKLYKLLTSGSMDQSTIGYFANYSAGKMSKQELKDMVRTVQQKRTGQSPAAAAASPQQTTQTSASFTAPSVRSNMDNTRQFKIVGPNIRFPYMWAASPEAIQAYLRSRNQNLAEFTIVPAKFNRYIIEGLDHDGAYQQWSTNATNEREAIQLTSTALGLNPKQAEMKATRVE